MRKRNKQFDQSSEHQRHHRARRHRDDDNVANYKTDDRSKLFNISAERNDTASYSDVSWHPLKDRASANEPPAFSQSNSPSFSSSSIRKLKPQNKAQSFMLDALARHNLVVALGPAGTGKTYLAISAAVEALESGRVGRLILSRPAIEAGAPLGFLPGGIEAKMDPWMRPLYDALNDRMGSRKLRQNLSDGTIEIAPIGFMRGRTLNNAFIVIDEAQNCTFNQLRMLLTRLGWHSTMVLTGDPDQSDLLEGMSGLSEVARRLEPINDIAVMRFSASDVVRHPLVAKMLGVLT